MNSDKIKSNLIKLTHSILVSGLSSLHLLFPNQVTKNLIFFTSEIYFIHDTNSLMKAENINYPIIYHHIVAMLLLLSFYFDYYGEILIYLYWLGESSNIFIYITYHLIKSNYDKNIIIYSNILQVIMYGYFRVYRMTYDVIRYIYLIYTPLGPLLGIYFLGLVWFSILCKQIYDERLLIKYLIIDKLI